jgi:2-amino-4-hydroxy-6-hydroxymethyldihydropteridine diphosphokinase
MPEAPRQYVIGLGANLGDRLRTLTLAREGLEELGELRAVSALYETAAVGPPQPDYLNAAVLLESALEPTALMGALLTLERKHGRERRERWGPRTLDLDLLFSPGLVLAEPGLKLPHPELCHRAFALAPLVDVAPDACDPTSGRLYADLLRQVATPDVRRWETTGVWRAG